MCCWQVYRGGAGEGQGGEGWSMGCQQSVEVPGRGMDDPLRCPLGTEELKKQTTTATKKGWCRICLSMATREQKPEWRLVFIERQRGIHIFLTKRKINIVVIMMDTVCCMAWAEDIQGAMWELRHLQMAVRATSEQQRVCSQSLQPHPLHLCNHGNIEHEVLPRLLCCPEGRSCAGWQHVCLLCSALHTGLNVQKPYTGLFFSTCYIYLHVVLLDFTLNY